ncbi:MAG: succinylglutamate desuccinylase/aspartoacylase family protein [Planctomycetota bacterium]|nr:succinylglutamate desuccinylase/aspartoacylase family protein [Planctomycetota bacterium]MDA1178841.1 succinylglutamate desuccinylase/aspartoacylase family protein [Planctomycetota bacterium]
MSNPDPSELVPQVDFETDGRHEGFVRLFHSTHASAYGFLPIPVVVFRNGNGPTALLMAGSHGDEFEGQIALCKLAKSLDYRGLHGRVILFPMANFPAASAGLRTSPIDNGNLNRCYPGRPNGTVTEQIAYFIEHVLLPKADVVCDLHSGGSSLQYLPSALIRRCPDPDRYALHLSLLRAFGAPHAYITGGGNGTGAQQTLRGAAERQGPLLIGTELGGGNTVSSDALRIAERGICNVLVHAGILPESMQVAAPPSRLLEVGGPEYFVYAGETGVFEPRCDLGDPVSKGQLSGTIHFPETPGKPAVDQYFARDGTVLCKRVPGRTTRGDCLFHLGSELSGDDLG